MQPAETNQGRAPVAGATLLPCFPRPSVSRVMSRHLLVISFHSAYGKEWRWSEDLGLCEIVDHMELPMEFHASFLDTASVW